MPTGFNPPLLFLRAYDHEGIPAPGAKLYHRVAGTELPKAIYYDPGLTSECPQPLVADAEGRFPQFFLEGGAYRFVLFDANDVQLRPPEDPIWGANGGSIFPTPTNSGFLYYDVDTDTYSWIQVEGAKVKVDADDPVAGYLSEKLTDSDTVHWEILPDHSGIQAVVQEGAGDTYKVKVNADDTTPGFLESKLADTTDTQFTPTEDGSQLDNIVYQLTGLGTRLNRVKNAGFDFDRGPFPVASAAGGRGISFGRRFVAGVEVDAWATQGNNGKLYWTSNNDASRWKVTTEDDSVYTAYPSARTYYGWSCIQFVYVAGTHNCFCWVMGSGDLPQTIVFVEHKADSYNADGTFKTSALNSVTYGPTTGPYSAVDIMQVDTTGGIFISGDDTKVGYTTDLATFTVALTAEHNVGGFGFDGETTVQIIERDSGVIWKSANYGTPGTFSKVTSFYLDDVLTTHFPTDNAAQWGSMFSMYGQWLSINFHYVSGGIGFIYSDDGIYWYSSHDEATQFYDANNDGLRWFATNAVPNSGTPIFQLIVSMIPVHRRLSIEKGAVVSGPLIMREIPNVPILGTDHRGRIINGSSALANYQLLDSDLTAIAALSTQAFGRSLLTQADEAAARATIGVAGAERIDRLHSATSAAGYALLCRFTITAAGTRQATVRIALTDGGSTTAARGYLDAHVRIRVDAMGSSPAVSCEYLRVGPHSLALGYVVEQDNASAKVVSIWTYTSGGGYYGVSRYTVLSATPGVGSAVWYEGETRVSTLTGYVAGAMLALGAGAATLQSLMLSSQTGAEVRPAIVATNGTVMRDSIGTMIQRATGYVGVRNPSRLTGEPYEFWDPAAGFADLRCGTVKLESLTASTIPVIDSNKKLASQDPATFRATIGAAASSHTHAPGSGALLQYASYTALPLRTDMLFRFLIPAGTWLFPFFDMQIHCTVYAFEPSNTQTITPAIRFNDGTYVTEWITLSTLSNRNTYGQPYIGKWSLTGNAGIFTGKFSYAEKAAVPAYTNIEMLAYANPGLLNLTNGGFFEVKLSNTSPDTQSFPELDFITFNIFNTKISGV